MSSPPRRGGGLKAFRLGDVPIALRRRHGARLTFEPVGHDPADALFASLQIQRAIEEPSERVYWIPRHAYERVMGAS
jgi:hypothetical protein